MATMVMETRLSVKLHVHYPYYFTDTMKCKRRDAGYSTYLRPSVSCSASKVGIMGLQNSGCVT